MFNFQLERQSARAAHINSTAADKRLVQFLYIFPVYCPLEPRGCPAPPWRERHHTMAEQENMFEFAKQQQLCLFPMCFCVSATQASSHVHMSRTNCSQRQRCPVALLLRLRLRLGLRLRFSGRLRCSLAIIIINSDAAAAAKISAICPACLRHKNMPGPAFSCGSSTPSYSSRFPIFPFSHC